MLQGLQIFQHIGPLGGIQGIPLVAVGPGGRLGITGEEGCQGAGAHGGGGHIVGNHIAGAVPHTKGLAGVDALDVFLDLHHQILNSLVVPVHGQGTVGSGGCTGTLAVAGAEGFGIAGALTVAAVGAGGAGCTGIGTVAVVIIGAEKLVGAAGAGTSSAGYGAGMGSAEGAADGTADGIVDIAGNGVVDTVGLIFAVGYGFLGIGRQAGEHALQTGPALLHGIGGYPLGQDHQGILVAVHGIDKLLIALGAEGTVVLLFIFTAAGNHAQGADRASAGQGAPDAAGIQQRIPLSFLQLADLAAGELTLEITLQQIACGIAVAANLGAQIQAGKFPITLEDHGYHTTEAIQGGIDADQLFEGVFLLVVHQLGDLIGADSPPGCLHGADLAGLAGVGSIGRCGGQHFQMPVVHIQSGNAQAVLQRGQLGAVHHQFPGLLLLFVVGNSPGIGSGGSGGNLTASVGNQSTGVLVGSFRGTLGASAAVVVRHTGILLSFLT